LLQRSFAEFVESAQVLWKIGPVTLVHFSRRKWKSTRALSIWVKIRHSRSAYDSTDQTWGA
jgi:hypothetical protein